ncbi:hypothetical protein [Sphingomonas sp.]|uniref:hypothetical protein n=1 Tax=Sphingomonas sp. TaxID=28214 RepID=UPI002DD65B16|nr:hypothetical protein [Sphingomonas sp.]
MLIAALLLIAPQEPFAAYREATRAERPCAEARTADEVTVCGRREADKRFRVPFVEVPVRDLVPRERAALLEDKIERCGRELMFRGCGMVGVTMTTSAAGTTLKPRKPAP